jgi:hypothetical protein
MDAFAPECFDRVFAKSLRRVLGGNMAPGRRSSWRLTKFMIVPNPWKEVILEANKDYWDKSKGPFMDRVIFRAIPENSVRFLELKAGTIHICQFPNAADIPMAKKDPSSGSRLNRA